MKSHSELQDDLSDDEEYYHYGDYGIGMTEIDERFIYYDNWLADSATTSHITNQREVFINYWPENGTTVVGVGDVDK
jgi:hypothetical protein